MRSLSRVRFSTLHTGTLTQDCFAVCFLAIIPLSKLFEYIGEQLAIYCGKDLGDLVIVSLNKHVSRSPSWERILRIILAR